jgi:hypothetical protein
MREVGWSPNIDIWVFPCFSQWWFSHGTFFNIMQKTEILDFFLALKNIQDFFPRLQNWVGNLWQVALDVWKALSKDTKKPYLLQPYSSSPCGQSGIPSHEKIALIHLLVSAVPWLQVNRPLSHVWGAIVHVEEESVVVGFVTEITCMP